MVQQELFTLGNKDKQNVCKAVISNKIPNYIVLNVEIDRHCITNCKNLQLLGVTGDSDLTFKPHIQEICKFECRI